MTSGMKHALVDMPLGLHEFWLPPHRNRRSFEPTMLDLRRQPLRALYIVCKSFGTVVRVPYWAIRYVFVGARPLPSWSWKRCMQVNITRESATLTSRYGSTNEVDLWLTILVLTKDGISSHPSVFQIIGRLSWTRRESCLGGGHPSSRSW